MGCAFVFQHIWEREHHHCGEPNDPLLDRATHRAITPIFQDIGHSFVVCPLSVSFLTRFEPDSVFIGAHPMPFGLLDKAPRFLVHHFPL